MIRQAAQADIFRISELLQQILKIHANGRPDIFKNNTQKYSAEEIKAILGDADRPIYVYEKEDGTIAGYVFCVYQRTQQTNTLQQRTSLYIDDLCVDEAERGKGIGSALLSYVIEKGKKEKMDSVSLNVWHMNEQALSFYRKCGMKPLKTTMEYLLEK